MVAVQYDPEYARGLHGIRENAGLHWRACARRYDPGHVLDVEIRGVTPAVGGRAKLELLASVGGGFAGQVYRARLLELSLDKGLIPGLAVGGTYAVKIMVPASGFRRRFRNLLYWVAYQGRFSAQIHPAASRAGALWQKFIRREAGARFGDERAVVDIYATLFDPGLGSFGEISEWVDGRNWRFEIDDEIFSRRSRSPSESTMSREFLAKKEFMAGLVKLFHDLGAGELARQYEWWSCKSQPNVLKRLDAGDGPADGLTALDFRPGLALLCWLPMSPVDVRLAVQGMLRGDSVQFDRCDTGKLRRHCEAYPDRFGDMYDTLTELESADRAYRSSLIDITHHGFRLFSDPGLKRNVRAGLIEGWRVGGLVDDAGAGTLRSSLPAFLYFWLLGALPALGAFRRRLWGAPDFRLHVRKMFSSFAYLKRSLRASQAGCLLDWYRDGAAGRDGCDWFLRHPVVFACLRFTVGLLPFPKLRRFVTDPRYAWRTTRDAVLFPVRFYRDADFREQWLKGEIEDGARKGMLTPEERAHILDRITDPFIRKYLKCVAVHFCTLPVTQVVSVLAAIYACLAFGETWQDGLKWAGGVLVAFQFLPISPGSFVRGVYVAYLIIRERNLKNYWIAMLLSFWHYIGYLSFPIQMVGEFPSLARYMAGRWATKMVHVIPVFGEEGALLEHWIFDTFFNRPVSLWKKMKSGQQDRSDFTP